jgi:hypothetical protein
MEKDHALIQGRDPFINSGVGSGRAIITFQKMRVVKMKVQVSIIAEPTDLLPVPSFYFLQTVKQVACRENQKCDQF